MRNDQQKSKVNYFFKKTIYNFFLIGLFFFITFGHIARAQDALDKEELKKYYREKIQYLEQEINNLRQRIEEEKSREKSTINDLKNIDFSINRLNLEIERLNYEIEVAKNSIFESEIDIENLTKNMLLEKKIISQLLRDLNEIKSNFSVFRLFFLNATLSGVFSNMQHLESIQERINARVAHLKELKAQKEQKIAELRERKEEMNELKALVVVQKRELALKKSNKERILFEIREAQKSYENTIEITKDDIERIKQQLYVLEGLGVKMSFADAYKNAKYAEEKTGVRAAFLLALLKKESEWGANIGKGNWKTDLYDCYMSLGKISKAQQEKEALFTIMQELKLDANIIQVSKAPDYGCGGALGPAQFLPSTWLAYKNRIAEIVGRNPPSPFNFGDAIIGAALKLKDLGAVFGNKKSEWKAVQMYFAGSRWNQPRYYFYGDSIMDLTDYYQKEIDILERQN